MADISPSKKKSTFAHKQTYSQKGNSKSLSIRSIVDELERLTGACPHVLEPLPPMIIEGMQPSEVHVKIQERFAEQNRYLRKARKELPERKGSLRTIRTDTHILVASIFSYPDSIADMVEEDYQAWRADVIAFAKGDAESNELEVMAIVEHRDEAHPHLHILAVPLITQANPRMNAKLCHEGHVAQSKHVANDWSGSPSRSYKQAMRSWQDAYHREVGSKHGQARKGPKRRRLDRATWRAEQDRITLLKNVEKAERRSRTSTSRAEAAEMREQTTAMSSAADRLQEAELVQRLSGEGLIEALRVVEANDQLIGRLTEKIELGGYASHDSDRRQILRETILPVINDGLEALKDLQLQGELAERFDDILAFATGWTEHLIEVMPRWLKWGEVVERIAHAAQQVFGWTYRPDSLVDVLEASPAWSDIEAEAEKELRRARDIVALSAQRTAENYPERSFGFRLEAD